MRGPHFRRFEQEGVCCHCNETNLLVGGLCEQCEADIEFMNSKQVATEGASELEEDRDIMGWLICGVIALALLFGVGASILEMLR